MRYTPAVAELVTDIADQSTNGLSPAAVGFALGAIFTMLLIQTAYVIAKILWWTSKG
jgi:hypothetical protein